VFVLRAQDPNTGHGFVDQQAGYHYAAPNSTDAVTPGFDSCGGIGGQDGVRAQFLNYSIAVNYSMAGVAAAVHFRAPHDVSFVDCSFHRLGGSALWLDIGAQNCSVTRCTFSDVSGSAVVIGGIGSGEDGVLGCGTNATRTRGNTIQNCTSSRTAVECESMWPQSHSRAGSWQQAQEALSCCLPTLPPRTTLTLR
jgi:hypothetical protein